MKNKANKTNKNETGFTLIELITVIAIIGILGILLVPSMINYVKKARVTAAIADAKVIKSAVESSLIDRLMVGDEGTAGAFNKVLYLDQESGKKLSDRDYEIVGAFTNLSWYVYKSNSGGGGKSQVVDKVIAGALEGEFSETWEKGAKVNPMSYNTNSKNCAKYLKDCNTNFGLVVVYNTTGSVRMMQLYRKGILVTYINGEFIANTDSNAHFIGTGTWSTIYTDSGKSSPEAYCKINLSNQQIGDNGKLGGWYS